MKDITDKVKSIFLEKTEETISVESLKCSECIYHFQDDEIDGKENEFKGKLSRIEFKEKNSSEIILYIQSTERPDKRTITIPGRIEVLQGNLIAYVPKVIIG